MLIKENKVTLEEALTFIEGISDEKILEQIAQRSRNRLIELADKYEKLRLAVDAYVNEPPYDIGDREVVLNRRHDYFRKMVFALKDLK